MKKNILIFLIACIVLSAFGQELPEDLLKAKSGYDQYLKDKNPKDLQQSLDILLENMDAYNNGYMLYDIGNIYYLMEDYPHALLYYKKALRFIPHYRNLKVNYEYTLKRLNQKESKIKLTDYLFFWTQYLHFYFQLTGLFVLWNLLWILLFAFRFVPETRKSILFKTSFYLLLCFFVYYTAGISAYYVDNFYRKHAIVMKDSALFKGPSKEYGVLKQAIPKGAQVQILQKTGDWSQISFQGKKGWVKNHHHELI